MRAYREDAPCGRLNDYDESQRRADEAQIAAKAELQYAEEKMIEEEAALYLKEA